MLFCIVLLLSGTPVKSLGASSVSKDRICGNPDSTLLKEQAYLEIKGFLTFKRKKLNYLDVMIYEEGKIVKQVNTRSDTMVKMRFYNDKHYSLVIKKDGFITAVIIVSTSMNGTVLNKVYHFDFEYEMIPVSNNLNKEFIDYPAAYIQFEKASDKFVISEKYNAYIRKSLGYSIK